ncbi:hypothetical protein BDA99DRAFT_543387 [Phascolomyces articulosus]|uniref:Uncharacterized protein n=1 Tax=Phascolomyces articulosus TaxID=60185 RepID=A0AAD5JMS2_9FUNG|nr:hypothetical protein BDA99DRAFT_543387 [Phascolomyces articulosus]
MLEQHTTAMFPLRACAGYWGARLIMVRAWNKMRIRQEGQETFHQPQQEEGSFQDPAMDNGNQSATTVSYDPNGDSDEQVVYEGFVMDAILTDAEDAPVITEEDVNEISKNEVVAGNHGRNHGGHSGARGVCGVRGTRGTRGVRGREGSASTLRCSTRR